MLEYTADILGQHRTMGTAGFGGSFAPLCGAALGNSSIEERLSETAPAERFRSTHAFLIFIIHKALTVSNRKPARFTLNRFYLKNTSLQNGKSML